MEGLHSMFEEAEKAMEKGYAYLVKELSTMAVYHVHPNMVRSVVINHGGEVSSLKQWAHISVHTTSTLVVKLWDKKLVPVVEKAFREKNPYGFGIRSEANEVFLSLPRPTEEMRVRLTKEVDRMGEGAKVSLRALRKKYKEQIKRIAESKDAIRRGEGRLQKLIDKYGAQMEGVCKEKKAKIKKI